MVEKVLADAHARGLKEPCLKKYRSLLNNHLLVFCGRHEFRELRHPLSLCRPPSYNVQFPALNEPIVWISGPNSVLLFGDAHDGWHID